MSPEIIPRWEWRTFGERFGAADERLAALVPERTQESDEVYVVALESDASVKVRAGQLDVKRLEEVDADGLERWKPVAKMDFPLTADQVREILALLGAEPPTLARDDYRLEDFLADVVGAHDDLLAVRVDKQRSHFMVGGCMAERSEFQTDHGDTATIGVESEDPAVVVAAARELGLFERRNVSVPRKLKALAGFGGRRFAILDIGTNSVKFHISERAADGTWTVIVDRAQITRLGEGLAATGDLGDEPMRRTADAIAEMAAQARREDVAEIVAVGTAGLRMADNRDAFIESVRERTGVEVAVVSGEEEARLAYLATVAELDLGGGSLVVFETGGGSSQFTIGRGRQVEKRFSLDVGAVRLTELLGLGGVVDDDALAAAFDAIAAELAPLDHEPTPDGVVGMGGAVTNLAAVSHALAVYDPDIVQGTVLDLTEIDRQIELYRTRDAAQRREITGLQPNRAEVILAGACIVRSVLTKLGRESLTVSDRGLRHGLLVERFGAQ